MNEMTRRQRRNRPIPKGVQALLKRDAGAGHRRRVGALEP
jgi:hypothetical protein